MDGVGAPAVLVAIVQTSCGIGMRMNEPPVVVRIEGAENVPVYENEPLVVLSEIWIASAVPMLHVHCNSGASKPRGKTVWSYG
jgi:hypothetical protein